MRRAAGRPPFEFALYGSALAATGGETASAGHGGRGRAAFRGERTARPSAVQTDCHIPRACKCGSANFRAALGEQAPAKPRRVAANFKDAIHAAMV